MTPKQKYLFESTRLSAFRERLNTEELSNAQAAIERLVQGGTR